MEFVPVTEESKDLTPGDEKSSGGCVLFERRESVEALLAESVGRTVSVSGVG